MCTATVLDFRVFLVREQEVRGLRRDKSVAAPPTCPVITADDCGISRNSHQSASGNLTNGLRASIERGRQTGSMPPLLGRIISAVFAHVPYLLKRYCVTLLHCRAHCRSAAYGRTLSRGVSVNPKIQCDLRPDNTLCFDRLSPLTESGSESDSRSALQSYNVRWPFVSLVQSSDRCSKLDKAPSEKLGRR